MDKITIIKNFGTSIEKKTELDTEGHLMLYMNGDKAEVVGSLSIHMFAPFIKDIARFFAKRFSGD